MRITPARAGKTLPAPVCIRRRRDHPRACGENVTNSGTAGAAVGSPPRVRGKHDLITTRIREIRITPARAGKTRCTPGPCQSHRDHPRACGENYSYSLFPRLSVGSPPRVRGKHKSLHTPVCPYRITPARAGKTTSCWEVSRHDEDHPRACGENATGDMLRIALQGSPPRVRGKLDTWRAGGIAFWITPARAGKTFALSLKLVHA